MYDITAKLGNFLVLLQPWLITFLVLSLVAIGVAYMINSEAVRAKSKEIFFALALGAAIAFGSKPIGQSIAGVFQITAILSKFIF